MRCLVGIILPVLMAVTIGCGGDGLKRVPIQGKLTAKGNPVPGASIQFLPLDGTKGEGGFGRSEADGSFTLTGSRAGEKGIVAGKYKVRVSRLLDFDGTVLSPDAKEADHPRAAESIPEPYSGIGSTLEVTVPEAGGALAVDLPVKVREGKK